MGLVNGVAESLSRRVVSREAAVSRQSERALETLSETSVSATRDAVSLSSRKAAEKTFQAAADKVDRLASSLEATGNSADAKLLSGFSDRLETAKAFQSEGNTPAAFRMLHAKQKVGLRNPEVQAALDRAQKAEDLMAVFGQPAPAAKLPVSKPFKDAAGRMNKLASALNKTGNPTEAQTLKDFAARLKKAGSFHAEGNTPASYRMLHASEKLGLRNPEVQAAIAKGHTAEDVLAAFDGKTAEPKAPMKPAVKPAVTPEQPVAKPVTPAKPAPVKPFEATLPGRLLDITGLSKFLDKMRELLGMPARRPVEVPPPASFVLFK